ncbi:MAG: endo-1,4-beta-xylanase, partial [Oscillospiraceae bacterium]|nr:endo-1,4-beta-xylanase [Oscillospiraceae bacterium]
FNGTKEALPEELDREGHYFYELYEAMKEMDKEDGYDVSGVVVWGIIDPNSWLQSRSNVGGGADGTLAQYPLLFDGDYQAKPAYWAFVDPSKLSAVEERAKAEMKITKGTVTVDGEIDDAWSGAEDVKLEIALGSKSECSAKLLWDEENLYVLAKVKDDVLNTASGNDYEQDSIEVFLDENNSKAGSYEPDDKQYRVSCENKQSFNGEKCNADNMSSAAVKTDDGYIIEAAFKWTDITPAAGTKIGIELQINDASADGVRIGTLNWSDDSNTSYMNTSVFGTAELTE